MDFQEKVTAAGRTFVFHREKPPTQVEVASGQALEKIDLKDPALVPTNLDSAEGTPLPILEADGVRVDLSKRTKEAMSFWHRNGDADEVILCLEGQIHWETELGNVTLSAAEMLVIPRGVAHRALPGTPGPGGQNLVVELKVRNPLRRVSVQARGGTEVEGDQSADPLCRLRNHG